MKLQQLEFLIIQSFCALDSTILEEIDEKAYYSHQDKRELIQSIDRLFKEIKNKGVTNLNVQDSKCKFCYPTGKAYSFHHPETREFIIRYVIAYDGETDEGEKIYTVEECRNKPIPDDFFEKMGKSSK